MAHSLETVPAISKGQCCLLLPPSVQTFGLLRETFLLLDLISRLHLGPTIAYLQKSCNFAQVGFWPQLVQDKWSFQDQ